MLNDHLHSYTVGGSYVSNPLLSYTTSQPAPKKHQSLFLLQRSFTNELRTVYWAERRLQRLFIRLQRSAFTGSLALSFKTHCIQSAEHLKRIEKIFAILEEKPSGKRCHVMVNIMNDAGNAIKNTKKHTKERDLALVRIAQRIEQYEINKYSGLIHLSSSMEEHKVTSLIELTLTEEREAEEAYLAIKENALKELFRSSDETNDLEAAEE